MSTTARGILTIIVAALLAIALFYVKEAMNSVGAILTVLTITAIALLFHAGLVDLP